MEIIVTQIDEGLFAEADLKAWARSFGDDPDDPNFEALSYLVGDPDKIKCDGDELYFMDVDLNGTKYILTSGYPSEQEKEMLKHFHGQERDNYFTLQKYSWDVYDAVAKVIAYRGGCGYTYAIWEYLPEKPSDT